MVTTSDVSYDIDGFTMIGRLALPEEPGQRPGILIAHEGPGLDDHQRDRASKFAEMGYVAFALDYHGGGQLILDRDEVLARLALLSEDPDRIRALGRAGLEILLGQPTVDTSKIAAVGYCFGGTVVLELARSGANLKAVIGMHPGLPTSRPEDATNIRGKVLVCVGSEDPLVPVDQRLAFEEEMRSAGVDWQMNIYGGAVHSFTHPWAEVVGIPYIKYDKQTDARSWRAMLDLFDEVFA